MRAAAATATALCLLLATGEPAVGLPSCGSGAHGKRGYGYAGHRAAHGAAGVRATITRLGGLRVRDGHVAAWVGIGGRGAGPGGSDQWLQVGLASLPGAPLLLYVEVTRAGAQPEFRLLDPHVRPGSPHTLALREVTGRPDWWRAWADGRPVTEPILLRGSSRRLQPIATAESWDGGTGSCNAFVFRFEDVRLLADAGWRPFVSGRRFRDAGFAVHALTRSDAGGGFAFVASARP
jgi:hypothetical protein